MKRLSYLIILSIFISCSDDEPINYRRDGDEVFDSMERLQELTGVSTFIGDLKIRGNDITSLESLRQLRTIRGNLLISDVDDLESLEGLNNLRHVEGIELFHNDILSNIDALGGVNSTNLLKLKTLPALASLDGLQTLNVDGSILISFLPQLTEIGDNITFDGAIAYNIYIANNDNLVNVDFISEITETTWMWISNNPKLELNDRFSNLERADIIHLENNELLTGLKINNLNYVESFHIEGNQNLLTIEVDGGGGISYESFDSPEISILNNRTLTEIHGFNNIPRAKILIFANNSLTTMTGLNGIEEVSLTVRENPQLTSMNLFTDQTVMVLELNFFQNNALNDFCGLNQLLTTDLSNADVFIEENGYNPTEEMLNSGECSSN